MRVPCKYQPTSCPTLKLRSVPIAEGFYQSLLLVTYVGFVMASPELEHGLLTNSLRITIQQITLRRREHRRSQALVLGVGKASARIQTKLHLLPPDQASLIPDKPGLGFRF